jgi:hypothetical protein
LESDGDGERPSLMMTGGSVNNKDAEDVFTNKRFTVMISEWGQETGIFIQLS